MMQKKSLISKKPVKLIKYFCYIKKKRKITTGRIVRYFLNLFKQMNLIKINKKNLFSKLSDLPVFNFKFKFFTFLSYVLLLVLLISLGVSFKLWQTWLLILTIILNQIVSINQKEKVDLGEMILKTPDNSSNVDTDENKLEQ